MLERRNHSRCRDFAAGTIAYSARGRGRAFMDCVVRNASEGGALLLVDEPPRAPVEMEVATRGGMRPARVVWRGETGVGVVFVDPGASSVSARAPVPAPAGAPAPDAPPVAVVVDLDAVRCRRAPGSGESRLAERIARFVRPPRRTDGA